MFADIIRSIHTVWHACEEHHGDGGQHWHAYVEFAAKTRARDKRLFDIAGIHPHVQQCGTTREDLVRIWVYLHKEGGETWGPWTGPPVLTVGKSLPLLCLLFYSHPAYR